MDRDNLIIIKLGSSLLVDSKGIKDGVLEHVLSFVARMKKNGTDVVIVSSGAAALGQLTFADQDVPRPLLSAYGQSELFEAYRQAGIQAGVTTAGVLLTQLQVATKKTLAVLQERIGSMLEHNIVPIVNENDVLSLATPQGFGDNDTLASILAVSFDVKKLFIFTSVGGLYTSDPAQDNGAELITEVDNVSKKYLDLCTDDTSEGGTGGMLSKIKASRICRAAGIPVMILGIDQLDSMQDADTAVTGTLVKPRDIDEPITAHDRWILVARGSSGLVMVDKGAEAALQQSKSLLAVGVKQLYGYFNKKEVVEFINEDKESVGFGITKIDSQDLEYRMRHNDLHDVQIAHTDDIFVL
jgi:glutamate 5-kinase